MKFSRSSLFCIVALFLLQVAATQPSQFVVHDVASPAAAGSSQPNLAVMNDHLYMNWLEPTPESGHALKFSEWDGKNWSAARTITSGTSLLSNWADFPSLRPLSRGMLAAQWPEKAGSGKDAYNVMVSVSTDAGVTWSRALTPHHDATESEHGFVSLLDLGQKRLGAVWLDGRKYAGSHPSNEMSLMFGEYGSGAFRPETILDGRVCDCCGTAAAVLPDGLFVVYRDRSPKEIRDMSYVRFSAGKWSEPKTLYADNWETNSCPVNGPAVAADGNRVAVAWFSAAGNIPRVQAIFSEDGGKSFGKPVRVDAGKPSGRVDVVWLSDKSALVSWIENNDKSAGICLRRIKPDGPAGPVFTAVPVAAGHANGFPRMARLNNDVLLAWTDGGEPTRIRLLTLE